MQKEIHPDERRLLDAVTEFITVTGEKGIVPEGFLGQSSDFLRFIIAIVIVNYADTYWYKESVLRLKLWAKFVVEVIAEKDRTNLQKVIANSLLGGRNGTSTILEMRRNGRVTEDEIYSSLIHVFEVFGTAVTFDPDPGVISFSLGWLAERIEEITPPDNELKNLLRSPEISAEVVDDLLLRLFPKMDKCFSIESTMLDYTLTYDEMIAFLNLAQNHTSLNLSIRQDPETYGLKVTIHAEQPIHIRSDVESDLAPLLQPHRGNPPKVREELLPPLIENINWFVHENEIFEQAEALRVTQGDTPTLTTSRQIQEQHNHLNKALRSLNEKTKADYSLRKERPGYVGLFAAENNSQPDLVPPPGSTIMSVGGFVFAYLNDQVVAWNRWAPERGYRVFSDMQSQLLLLLLQNLNYFVTDEELAAELRLELNQTKTVQTQLKEHISVLRRDLEKLNLPEAHGLEIISRKGSTRGAIGLFEAFGDDDPNFVEWARTLELEQEFQTPAGNLLVFSFNEGYLMQHGSETAALNPSQFAFFQVFLQHYGFFVSLDDLRKAATLESIPTKANASTRISELNDTFRKLGLAARIINIPEVGYGMFSIDADKLLLMERYFEQERFETPNTDVTFVYIESVEYDHGDDAPVDDSPLKDKPSLICLRYHNRYVVLPKKQTMLFQLLLRYGKDGATTPELTTQLGSKPKSTSEQLRQTLKENHIPLQVVFDKEKRKKWYLTDFPNRRQVIGFIKPDVE